MNGYLIKVEDHPTLLHQFLWASYHGNHYMDQDGESYVMTSDPENTNKLGKPILIGHATSKELAWTRERPGTFPLHLNFELPGK